MATFKDEKHREWDVRITGKSLRIVRESTGYEINKIAEEPLENLTKLITDTEKFLSVLHTLVKDQRPETTLDDFLESLAGDVLEEAREAFVKAYAFFSPSRIRKLLLAILEKGLDLQEAAMAKVMAKLDSIDPEKLLTSSANSGSLPAPSECAATT